MGTTASTESSIKVVSNQLVDSAELSGAQELKIYRQLRNEYRHMQENGVPFNEAATHLLQKHISLEDLYRSSEKRFKCPTVRFGRTEIQMPIITLGGMRQQQTWTPADELTFADIKKDCQDNFVAILDRAMDLGINHIETARGYGTSETQYGVALAKYPRASYILQTKCAPKEKQQDFIAILEKSFAELQLGSEGYVDLLSFHGINRPEHIEWVVRPGGCLEVVREWQKAGRIRYVGFSTHAMAPVIVKAIETGEFDYVNLHYQFVGSYTATGSGSSGTGGNYDALIAAQKHDMGVFIISATDKGGALYEPSRKMYKTCLPLTPISFNNLWLWMHSIPIHTLVVGAARPSDLDEHVEAAMQLENSAALVGEIQDRLYSFVEDRSIIPFDTPNMPFMTNWYFNLPTAYENDEGIPTGYIYWLWWICKAWGMYSFALKRYASLEDSLKTWDDLKSPEENKKSFSWVPGVAFRVGREQQLQRILEPHPRGKQVMSAILEVHGWLSNGGCLATRIGIPTDTVLVDSWKTAYNLQPDIPYPERK